MFRERLAAVSAPLGAGVFGRGEAKQRRPSASTSRRTSSMPDADALSDSLSEVVHGIHRLDQLCGEAHQAQTLGERLTGAARCTTTPSRGISFVRFFASMKVDARAEKRRRGRHRAVAHRPAADSFD